MVTKSEGAKAYFETGTSHGTTQVDGLTAFAGPREAHIPSIHRAAPRLLLAPGDPVRERSIVDAVTTSSAGNDTGLARPFRIVRRCVTAAEVLAGLAAGQADVALLGSDLHGLDSDTLRAVAKLQVPLVVLGAVTDEGAWADRGARNIAVLPASADPDAIRRALVAAFTGQTLVEELAAVRDRVEPPEHGDDWADACAPATHVLAAGATSRGGVLLAVVGARGSHGCTTVSINLAAALGRSFPTVLVDSDIVDPSVATALNLNPARNAYMVSLEDPGSDPVRWAVALESELQRLDFESSPQAAVLCGVPKPGLRSALTPGFLTELLSQLGLHYRYVVADLGSAIDEAGAVSTGRRALLDLADRVLVVATPDIVGLRRAASLLEILQRDRAHDANRLALVLNRHRVRHHHSAAEIAQTLRVSVAAVLPEDVDAFQRALSAQRPLVAFGRGRRGSAARAFQELARLVEEAHREWRDGGATGLSIDGHPPVGSDTVAVKKRSAISWRWPRARASWRTAVNRAGAKSFGHASGQSRGDG